MDALNAKSTIVAFGMGFSAQGAARAIKALAPGATIIGTTRSAENFPGLAAQGIVPRVFSGEAPNPELADDLTGATHVIASIAPNASGDPVLAQHPHSLDAAKNLRWLCYYSTIGVYGDAGGDWINETYPLSGSNQRLAWRIAAEDSWRAYAQERRLPLAILRLAGIYGPGRSTFDKLRDGTARRLIKPGQVFNRIHVDDIGRITALAAQKSLDGTFNLADDEPAPPQDLVTFAADMLGMAPPPETPFETAELSPMARSFYDGNRRVSNQAIKSALQIDLIHPDYRRGLTSIRALETRA